MTDTLKWKINGGLYLTSLIFEWKGYENFSKLIQKNYSAEYLSRITRLKVDSSPESCQDQLRRGE